MTLNKLSSVNIGKPREESTLAGIVNTNGSCVSTAPTSEVSLTAGAQRQLEVGDPNKVSARVRECASTLLPSLRENHSHDFTLMGYSVGREDIDKLQSALRIVEQSMEPLPHKLIRQHIKTITPLVTLGASFDPDMLIGKTEALARELSQYPADIVVYAVDKDKKKVKFFPSFAEFAEICEPMVAPRKLLLNKLHKCIDMHR